MGVTATRKVQKFGGPNLFKSVFLSTVFGGVLSFGTALIPSQDPAIPTALSWIGASPAMAQASDPVIAQAESLVDSGQFQEAYDLLLPLEDARAGDVDYDYFLALSSLRIGEITRSIYALERVLIVDPNHGPARVLLGEAYFTAGETEAAKETFEVAQSQAAPTPGPIRDRIERFLFAIDRSTSGFTFNGTVYAGLGYDGNVNSATDKQTLVIPAFAALGPATLGTNSRSQDDMVWTAGTGFFAEQRMEGPISMLGSLSYDRTDALGSGGFDTDSLNINLGVAYTGQNDRVTITGQYQPYFYGYNHFRDTLGALAVWRHAFSDSLFGALFGQASTIYYPTQNVRNANRFAIGANVVKQFDVPLKPEVFAQVYGGIEKTHDSANRYLGNDFIGGRLGVDADLIENQLEGYVSSSLEYRDYRGTDPLFLKVRDDYQLSLTAGVRYQIQDSLSIEPEISYTDNSSNISLYSFDRLTGMVTLRYDF
ncbi:MAG: tetratricopeptide repeat protein [Rhodospirillaceae bacterium]